MALASAISLGTLRRQLAGRPEHGTPVAVDGRGRTWTGSFERALFVVFGLIVVNDVAVSMQWLSQAFGVSGGIGRAAIVVAVGALGCSAVLILFGFLGPALVYLTVGAVAGAQLVFVWAEPDASALPGTWWAWQLMIPTSILVCAGLPLSRAAPVLAVLLTGYAGLRLSPGTGPGHGLQATISDLSCFVLFAAMVLVTVGAWRRTAEMSDQATRSRNRSHAATEAARAGDRQRRAVARLLHDEVIHSRPIRLARSGDNTLGNNGMAHIHVEVSSQPNCRWVGGRYLSGSTPFDSAHGTRLECAPELPAGGPIGMTGQGQWSRTALANTCQGIRNGDFVVVRETGAVFRVAGGAPICVSTWSAFGGAQPTKSISQAQLDAMATVPANGTFVVGAQRGEVYGIAGGAPLYVSNWAVFGGPQPTVTVDQAAIDNAGAGSVWNHLRTYPADGTFVSTSPRGEVYRIAGGAPLYVSNWAVFGGAQPTTTVDAGDVDNAGAGSVWNHLRTYPADGTFVLGVQSNNIYRVMRGAARYVPTWDIYGGRQPYTPVDQGDIDNAGAGGVWNHLVPATSTLGDLNSDGYVGCADQAVLQAHFGETPAGPGHGDLNSDGTINVIDLSILLSHWAPPPGDSC